MVSLYPMIKWNAMHFRPSNYNLHRFTIVICLKCLILLRCTIISSFYIYWNNNSTYIPNRVGHFPRQICLFQYFWRHMTNFRHIDSPYSQYVIYKSIKCALFGDPCSATQFHLRDRINSRSLWLLENSLIWTLCEICVSA